MRNRNENYAEQKITISQVDRTVATFSALLKSSGMFIINKTKFMNTNRLSVCSPNSFISDAHLCRYSWYYNFEICRICDSPSILLNFRNHKSEIRDINQSMVALVRSFASPLTVMVRHIVAVTRGHGA